MKKLISILILFVTIILSSSPAFSHTTSTSYLNLNLKNDTISGVWQVTLNDIHLVLGLDSNDDSRLIWSEIIHQKSKINYELNKSISILTDKSCTFNTQKLMIDRRAVNVYLHVVFNSNCQSKSNFTLNYNFLFDQDAFHKTILTIHDDTKSNTAILSYSNQMYQYNKLGSYALTSFIDFIVQGIIHVLIGLDHVLFVICLLLSATLLVKNNFKRLMANTFKLVTAFTIAHSITLILASTKILSIPPTIIEPVIALSVIVLALLNLWQTRKIKHWPIVFSFGLIHGFGFAFVLEEVTIQPNELITSLLGFNLGVELGQLVIVVLVLPLLYFLSTKLIYNRYIIPISSSVIAFIGLYWLVERTGNLNFIL